MERAASTADPHAARQVLTSSMERIRGSLVPGAGENTSDSLLPFTLPFPKCYTCSWDSDTFGNWLFSPSLTASVRPRPEPLASLQLFCTTS